MRNRQAKNIQDKEHRLLKKCFQLEEQHKRKKAKDRVVWRESGGSIRPPPVATIGFG